MKAHNDQLLSYQDKYEVGRGLIRLCTSLARQELEVTEDVEGKEDPHQDAALDEAGQKAQGGVANAVRERAKRQARDISHQRGVRNAPGRGRHEERNPQRHCLLVVPPQQLRQIRQSC